MRPHACDYRPPSGAALLGKRMPVRPLGSLLGRAGQHWPCGRCLPRGRQAHRAAVRGHPVPIADGGALAQARRACHRAPRLAAPGLLCRRGTQFEPV